MAIGATLREMFQIKIPASTRSKCNRTSIPNVNPASSQQNETRKQCRWLFFMVTVSMILFLKMPMQEPNRKVVAAVAAPAANSASFSGNDVSRFVVMFVRLQRGSNSVGVGPPVCLPLTMLKQASNFSSWCFGAQETGPCSLRLRPSQESRSSRG